MEKIQVHTVKIYFIEPVELITVVIDTLLKLEFETYIVKEEDKEKLLKILKNDIRNVIFLSIINELEAEKYLQYVTRLNGIPHSLVQIGAFIHGNIKQEARMKLLEQNCAAIQFTDIQKDPLAVLKKILMYFEAKGTRKHVRVRAVGISEAYFTVKTLENPIKAIVLDISSHAFLCKVPLEYLMFFVVGDYCQDVLLVLKGMRLRISAKILGFSKEHPDIFILKFFTAKVIDNKFKYEAKIPQDIRNKLHTYIKLCLKENLALQLSTIKDEPPIK